MSFLPEIRNANIEYPQCANTGTLGAMTDHVGGIVLAAGAGTRFGMPKVLAAEGQWLSNAVAALDGGGCDDVVVVLGAAVVDVPPPARVVRASDWAEGMSASLRAGLAALDTADYAVVVTVDTPDVGADAVRRVLDVAQGSRSGLARAHYSERPGHPVVIGRRHWSDLVATLRGDEGARSFLNSRSDVVAVDCADLATGADIDVNRQP
jgi:CTP:molybdopterin cytidylyltransferase MocA